MMKTFKRVIRVFAFIAGIIGSPLFLIQWILVGRNELWFLLNYSVLGNYTND